MRYFGKRASFADNARDRSAMLTCSEKQVNPRPACQRNLAPRPLIGFAIMVVIGALALAPSRAEQDDVGRFVSRVLGSTELQWKRVFAEEGKTYRAPVLVLYRGATKSSCGGVAESTMGPFYCPSDQKIYLDRSFFDQIATRFPSCDVGSKSCQFSQAYVIAHLVGRHVQNLLGILPKAQQAQRAAADKAAADHIQMQLGLQADCLAGIWANRENEMLKSEGKPVFIKPVDVEAALRIYAVPESPTHGTWEQRQRWFNNGFRSGSIQSCNTFAATPADDHYAQSAPMFTNKDIPTIVETSRSNEIRFNRDYKGKIFSDVLPFTRASETWLGGGYRVGFGSKGMGGGGVDCQISDPKVLNEVVEWNPGLMVSVTGRIKTTSMGDLQLENCDLVVKK
jgi:predicted metalloprotease